MGADRVDLVAALQTFARRGIETVRVDSGGALIGALLARGLLDEVSLLVHPVLVGERGTRRWYGPTPPPAGAVEVIGSNTLDGGLVWLRYRLRAGGVGAPPPADGDGQDSGQVLR